MFNPVLFSRFLATGTVPESTALDAAIAEWEESKHPRGQVGNKGQFKAKPETGDKADKLCKKERGRLFSVEELEKRARQAEDAEYMDAVKRGDTDKCAKMVAEAFARKAPKTKVTNRSGQPRVIYHGTPNGRFNVFDKNRIGETWNADETGFFLTSSESLAKDYSKPEFREHSADPQVFSMYMKADNPLVIDSKWWQKNFGRSDIYRYDAVEIWDDEQSTILEAMKQGNYDGIIIDPNPMAGDPMMYVAFSSEQIKSSDPVTYDDNGNPIPLSNRFDFSNPDIRY